MCLQSNFQDFTIRWLLLTTILSNFIRGFLISEVFKEWILVTTSWIRSLHRSAG